VLCAPWQARAQDAEPQDGAVIESVDVSGLPRDQLSPGLRREIDALTGEPLNRQQLTELAGRIEGELPEFVAAVRTIARPGGQARVIFLLARISDDGSLVENINARYTVESVDISGVPENDISKSLRDRLQTLVGKRLDHDEADELSDLLEAERPGYSVNRRIRRGSERGRIRVVFEFSEKERPRWIPFTPSRSKFVYHSDQGWSGLLDIPMGNRNHRVTAGFAFSNNDDLIEEYSGVRLGFESRRLGTDRLGARVEIARFNDTWREPTLFALAADPTIPEAYRTRIAVEPSVTVGLTPNLRVTGGASINELESLTQSPNSQMASSLVARVDFDQRWFQRSDASQRVTAGYELKSATSSLESDLIYKRHTGRLRYRYELHDNTVISDLFIGRITGTAPLFERFSLGDSTTLRGWNKFDIAPVGGDRVFHHTLEYRYHVFGVFLDTGAVWDQYTEKRIRFSSGFGLQGDNGFLTLAFPLNTDDLGVTFTMGVRF
jgi:outer membrane protein assembly factor BamA